MATKKKKSTKKKVERYETLHDLLILKLRALHDVENQLTKALPKMAKAAHDEKLREAFAAHLEETKRHEERIDTALELLGDTSKGKIRVEAIRGLIADSEWIVKSIKNPEARDTALIAAAQYVEHYEMSGYGSAIAWADRMDHREVRTLLEDTLGEEEAADAKLNSIALNRVNANIETGHEAE